MDKMIRLATWNVNSLKVRLEQVLAWVKINEVDVLALQETKIEDNKFPVEVFKEHGFHVSFSGQKTYNGVAIVSRYPQIDICVGIPLYSQQLNFRQGASERDEGVYTQYTTDGERACNAAEKSSAKSIFDDPQRRILVVTVAGFRLINLYVPNGAVVDSEKYQYKLAWLAKVRRYIEEELKIHHNLAVVGDFNIAPADIDVHDPASWEGSVLVSPAERVAYQALLALGLNDSFRSLNQDEQVYSWWDYRAGGFRRNHGARIDHILLNEALLKNCRAVIIDKNQRAHERPSDHAPVIASLEIVLNDKDKYV